MRRALISLGVCVACVLGVFGPAVMLLGDTSYARGASLGFYLLGSLVLVLGFAQGSRGPLRSETRDGRWSPLAPRRLRRVTPGERRDGILTALAFFGFGLTLIVLGVLIDDRVPAF